MLYGYFFFSCSSKVCSEWVWKGMSILVWPSFVSDVVNCHAARFNAKIHVMHSKKKMSDIFFHFPQNYSNIHGIFNSVKIAMNLLVGWCCWWSSTCRRYLLNVLQHSWDTVWASTEIQSAWQHNLRVQNCQFATVQNAPRIYWIDVPIKFMQRPNECDKDDYLKWK